MPNSTKNLHPNTVAFACLEPEVAILIVDVILTFGSYLRWRPVAKYLLAEILVRLAEGDSFELTHDEFSAAIWPHLDKSAREQKFCKWIAKIKEEMELSNCPAVEFGKPRTERHIDGSFKSLPTLYLRGVFWRLFKAVQEAAIECNLMGLSVRSRRARVRVIVAEWLRKYGAKPIDWQKKVKDKKPAKSSPPCRCDCPSCQLCAAKSATGSEANGRGARVEELRRQPNEDFGAELQRFVDFFGRHLREIGEVGKEFAIAVKRAHTALEIEEQDAREMITTENKRECVRQYIKLVGGQPK